MRGEGSTWLASGCAASQQRWWVVAQWAGPCGLHHSTHRHATQQQHAYARAPAASHAPRLLQVEVPGSVAEWSTRCRANAHQERARWPAAQHAGKRAPPNCHSLPQCGLVALSIHALPPSQHTEVHIRVSCCARCCGCPRGGCGALPQRHLRARAVGALLGEASHQRPPSMLLAPPAIACCWRCKCGCIMAVIAPCSPAAGQPCPRSSPRPRGSPSGRTGPSPA